MARLYTDDLMIPEKTYRKLNDVVQRKEALISAGDQEMWRNEYQRYREGLPSNWHPPPV